MAAGKTVTVRVSGGAPDYTSIQAALAGEAADFTSATTGSVTVGGKTWDDIALYIECDPAGGDDSTQVTINQAGWALDSTHRLLIATKDSAWPSDSSSFVPGSSGLYSIVISNASFYIWKTASSVALGSLVVSGLELRQTASGAGSDKCLEDEHSSAAGDQLKSIYDSMIFYNASSDAGAIAARAVNRHIRFQNCYAECVGGDGFNVGTGSYDCYFYNCLAVNCGGMGYNTNTSVASTLQLINCIGYNNTGDDFNSAVSSYEVALNNASEDGTHVATAGGQTITGADFETAGTDWTPASGGNLEANGYDAVTGGYMVNEEDAVGYTRVNWDIGPLERQGGGGGSTALPLLNAYYG